MNAGFIPEKPRPWRRKKKALETTLLDSLTQWSIEHADRIKKLENQSKEDAYAIVVLYEALGVLTTDPGSPHASAQAARDVLGFLNTTGA